MKGHFSFTAEFDKALVGVARIVRLILVQDTLCGGAQAASSDLFTDWGTIIPLMHSFQQVGQITAKRFRVLKDFLWTSQMTVAVNDAAAADCSYNHEDIHFSFMYKPKQGIPVNLKVGTGTPAIANIMDNNFFVIACASGGSCAMTAVTRVYYTDD